MKIVSILKSKGLKFCAFRVAYELRRKCGLLKRRFPTSYLEQNFISLEDFRKLDNFFFVSRRGVGVTKHPSPILAEAFNALMEGNFSFFSCQSYHVGKKPDWFTNVQSGYRYDSHRHWTQIRNFDEKCGDIKYVWELSRFSWLYTVVRYDYHFDEDHSEWVFSMIEDWIDQNILNCGPNYICSQEISLRVLNWIFALYFYREAPTLTDRRWRRIINSISWQVNHIYRHINFSRICVSNNHAITETLTLYLCGLLFPYLPHARRYKENGKKWFEEEIAYQIAEEGTFIQNSMNYHRVVVQLLSWAIALSDRNGEIFAKTVYDRAYHSVDFLYQCQEQSNGWLPNYGANDGAWFFPLTNTDYRDYRPQLDALHRLLTNHGLYGEDGQEEGQWYGSIGMQRYSPVTLRLGLTEYKESGYYLYRESDILTFIRCGLFKGIPGQADELHVDIWSKGENILLDGGSYQYNTDVETMRYFSGTESHNTVMIDGLDQMLKGPRFIWYSPTKIVGCKVEETSNGFKFEGTINCYRYLKEDILHRRTLVKEGDRWYIKDEMFNLPQGYQMRQLWHTRSKNLIWKTQQTQTETIGWTSDYYGYKEAVRQVEIRSNNNNIETIIEIK